MPGIDSLETMLVEELKDLYDAERRLTKAIPKMIKATTNADLRTALDSHLAETEEHVARLERAFQHLDTPAKGKPCAGMKGIIEEGDEHISEEFEDDALRDATIIGSAQRVEHYEIAAYGTAMAHAKLLGQNDVVGLLQDTLDEEKAADEKLTEIAESVVNFDAASRDEGDEGDEDAAMETEGSIEPVDTGERGRSVSSSSGRRSAATRSTRH